MDRRRVATPTLFRAAAALLLASSCAVAPFLPAAEAASQPVKQVTYCDGQGAAVRLGFDGVAIHSAHGYLLHEFLWDFTNRRDDAYGGDAARRRRLLVEIVEGCRAATDAMALQRSIT